MPTYNTKLKRARNGKFPKYVGRNAKGTKVKFDLGYEPTTLDMMNAHRHLVDAAPRCGRTEWADAEVDRLVERGTASDRQDFSRVLISERRQQT